MCDQRSILIEMAKLAGLAKRKDDMAAAMKAVTEMGFELSIEERNILFVAYKNVVVARRTSLRAISYFKNKIEVFENKQQMAKQYEKKIEKELRDICYEALGLLDDYLLPKASDVESKVFYLKMKGDYFRYLAQVATGKTKITVVEDSQKAYQDAFEICSVHVATTDPIRLCLALNFSVFYYETLNCPKKALQLAKKAFDDAIAKLDTLNEDRYKAIAFILQLLFNNLIVWTTEIVKGGEEGQEVSDEPQEVSDEQQEIFGESENEGDN